jgi:hypothetical protein
MGKERGSFYALQHFWLPLPAPFLKREEVSYARRQLIAERVSPVPMKSIENASRQGALKDFSHGLPWQK